MDNEREKTVAPPAKRKPSAALNLLLMLIAFAWLAILVKNGSPKIERWVAAIALALVGVTGLVSMALAKRAPKPAGADEGK